MNARMLVVEAEPAIPLALKGILKREGHEVDLADTGEQAIEFIREISYDLILTDLSLGPGASGMDVLKAAKEHRVETSVVITVSMRRARSTMSRSVPLKAL